MIQSPKSPRFINLRFAVYLPSQILQSNRRFLSFRLCLSYCQKNTNSRVPSLDRSYPASSLLRTHPPSSRLRRISQDHWLFRLPCSDNFSSGRVGLLQLLCMSLLSCRRSHPAKVNNRFNQFSIIHAAFVLAKRTRPSELCIFEATNAFTVVTA